MYVLWQRIITVASLDEDVRRRGHLLIQITLSLLVITAFVIPLTLLGSQPSPALEAEMAGVVCFLLVLLLARRGWVTTSGILVIATIFLAILVSMIAAPFIGFFSRASFLVMPLMIAALVLRPVQVWAVLVMIILGLAVSIALSSTPILAGPDGYGLVSGMVLLLVVVTLFSFFAARATASALAESHLARLSAEQAAASLELTNLELEQHVAQRTIASFQYTSFLIISQSQIASLVAFPTNL